MKKYILIILLVAGQYCSAQHFSYTYDNAGNRITRTYSVYRMANPNPPKDSIDVAAKYGVSVYPNPTSDNINVVIAKLENGQSADVYLFDTQGKSLLTKKQTTGQEMVEFTGLSSGIYQLKVVVNGEQVSYRIVKL